MTTATPPRVSARVGAISGSPTLAVDARAKAVRAAGRPVVVFGAGELELAELILEEAEVAVVPGEAFGTPGYLRLSYALGEAA